MMTCRAWLRFGIRVGVIGLALAVGGSVSPAGAERLAIRTFTATDGLPRDQVTALLADSRGFLWVGTQEGLARFDGGQFTVFGPAEGLANAAVYDLVEDRGGRYWIATGGGMYRFTPSPRQFLRVSEAGATPGGASRAAMVLLEDREGTIWCGSSEGLLRVRAVRGGAAEASDASERLVADEVPLALDPTEHGRVVGALLEARDGTLWIGSGSGLFRRTRDGRVDRFTRADGLPDHEVWALAQDAAGDLWVGTRFGLAQLDVSRSASASAAIAPPRVIHVYTERDGLPAANVKSLLAEPDGAIRVGLTAGVVRLTRRAALSQAQGALRRREGNLGREALLRKNLSPPPAGRGVWGEGGFAGAGAHAVDEMIRGVRVRDLASDSAGHLWMATDRGAMRLAHGGFTTYGEDDGVLSSRVRSLFEDPQGRVCATVRLDGYRIQCFDGQRFSSATVPIGGDALETMWGWLQLTVVDRDGSWWFPTAKGLYRFPAGPIASIAHRTPSAVYTRRDGLDTDHIFRLFEDSRGDLWMSTFTDTRGGLCRRARATGSIDCFGLAGGMPAQAPTAYAFAEDRAGRVWVAFQDGYLARCDPHDTRCTFVMRDNHTLGGVLRDLHVDRAGRLWIASASGGLARIDDPTAASPRVDHLYTLADGLASQTIWAITEDDAGRIYLAGGRGVDRLDPRTREIVNFSEADGLARGEVRAAMRAADGTLWFAAAEGLSRLSPSDDPSHLVQPVRIVGLRVAGAAHPVSDAGDRAIDGLRLSSQARAIEIDFVSPRFGVGRDLLYQYRLEGLDAEWQPPTRQHSVTYAHLPAGTHRFEVRALSADGRSVSPPATVTFTVERPFWQRWWFVTLLIGLGASALAAWHRVRLARIVEIERVRTRIASDLHDEIGAGLSEIAILSEVANQRLTVPATSKGDGPLTRIASTSRELVDAMSDIVWAINPRKDSLGNLTQRMRRFATDLLTARGIDFRFDADERDEALPISADKRRHVFLIFKESLNNVVRHAECQHVAIDFRVNHDGLVLRVADDGLGLAHAHNGRGPAETGASSSAHVGDGDGHGLASMHARARELGGTLTVTTEQAGGTTLILRTPFVRSRAARLIARVRMQTPTKVRR
jgi:ligand-binding sensor domain-containing protein/signal transduction histidine kinase